MENIINETKELVDESKIEGCVNTDMDIKPYSEYARWFVVDEYCGLRGLPADYARLYLASIQDYFNNVLKFEGRVYLNQVYEALEFSTTPIGDVVGWDKSNPNSDGYIDFGIFDIERVKENSGFVNGYDRKILLDFNVDEELLSTKMKKQGLGEI